MSSDVWNAARQQDAKTMYEQSSQTFTIFGSIKTNEINGLKKITYMCKEMNETFNEVIQDQNNYIIEFETLETNFVQEQNNINQKIEKLLAEVKVLEAKEQDGTITEDELKELSNKKVELNNLYNTSSLQYKEKKTQLQNRKEQIKNKYSEKEKIATDYGNLAVEKGNNFLDEDVTKEINENGGKIKFIGLAAAFGFSKYTNHFAGQAAIDAGSELLEKVEDSTLVDKKITSKNIK